MHPFATLQTALVALALVLAADAASAQRTVVIEPGAPGVFNRTITGDTTATGDRVDPNTTYVLLRGRTYLYTEQIVNQGYPLTVVAEAGSGALPVLQAAGVAGAEAPRPFRAGGDLALRDLYIYGLDDLGVNTDNATVRIEAEDIRVDLDGVVFGANRLSSIRINRDGATVNIRNCVFSYIFNPNSPDAWVIRINSGIEADTLRVINSTFYNNDSAVLNNQLGSADLVEFRHNTFYNTGGRINFTDAIDGGVTDQFVFRDNIVYNAGYYGNTEARGVQAAVGVDTTFVEDDGNPETPPVAQPFDLNVANLNIYIDPAIVASFPDSVSVRAPVDSTIQDYLDANGGRDVFSEPLAFADAPSTQSVIDRLAYFYANLTTQGGPFLDGDPRDPANSPATPPTTAAEQVPVDFSYPTSARSYTAAAGGCPLGDLNWFPDRYDECTAASDRATPSEGAPARVSELRVSAPAPNPTAGTATIRFDLPQAADVSVALYDLLGRTVYQTAATATPAGADQSVRLDVSALPAGVYVFRLRADAGGAVSGATGRLTVVR